MKLFLNPYTSLGGKLSLSFFSIFSSGGYLVHQSETVSAILVEDHPRNISMKLFCNRAIGLGGAVVLSFFFLF